VRKFKSFSKTVPCKVKMSDNLHVNQYLNKLLLFVVYKTFYKCTPIQIISEKG